MKLTKVEIIFEPRQCREYGWYSRTTDIDGQQEDRAIEADWWEDALVPDATVRAWAMSYYRVPAEMIEVRRANAR